MLTLEGAQAGLSWDTILRKRQARVGRVGEHAARAAQVGVQETWGRWTTKNGGSIGISEYLQT